MAPFKMATLQTAAIHIPGGARLPVHFAAEELQRYLHLMTGLRLPIGEHAGLRGGCALVLGVAGAHESRRAPPQRGGFAITPEATRISMGADSPRALLDAVYALLEQFGCRWSLHGPREESVPRLTPSVVELHPVHRAPHFEVRGYCSDIMTWHYTQPEHLDDRLADDRAFIDWMGKSGANAFFYIRHPFDSQLTIPELTPEFQRRGIDVEYGGHVMPLLLPRELYRDHPEYFPEMPEGGRTDHGNLCTSNGAALAAASANAVRYVREYPEVGVLHIWGADLWRGGWCRCAGCRSVSAQDQSLRVCNAVARGLADAGMARPVCYLAYHDTLTADLTLRPDENVVVEFAPRERCYEHALNDPECATNRRYAEALQRYVELFEGRARLFEYYGDAILFFGCAVPLTDTIAADMEYYRRLGVRDVLMLQFGLYSLWAYPLNFLAFGSLAAGHNDPQPFLDAYCARFGAHASAASALFTELEAIMRPVVTYGDIRRPPRAPDAAGQVLTRVDNAVPQLSALARRLEMLDDDRLRAAGVLVRYTETVLRGVQEELRQTVVARPAGGAAAYADGLQIIEAVERRFKGLWGAVDLPIIHSFYAAAAAQGE